MATLNEIFRKIILANELENNLKYVYRLSDADGVRSGKSGYSFGMSQFDTQNNDQSLACLRECEFTSDEIKWTVAQSPGLNLDILNAKLLAHSEIIDRYDTTQLSFCLNKAINFDVDFGIQVADVSAMLAGADYVNQYGSQGHGAVAYYKALGRPITALDVLNFKLTVTKYGKDHPDDCKRRYNNLIRIYKENA